MDGPQFFNAMRYWLIVWLIDWFIYWLICKIIFDRLSRKYCTYKYVDIENWRDLFLIAQVDNWKLGPIFNHYLPRYS